MNDMLQVTYDNRICYIIPGIWLAGFCRDGRTVRDAIEYWHSQELLTVRWRDQQT